jgi:Sec-independent protein translocase protein TatA
MEILGIGPLEFLFIILLALIVLGPKDLQKTGKSIGKGLTKIVKSDAWKNVRDASEKMRSLPNELMREAGVEDIKKSLDSEIIQPVKQAQRSLDSLTGGSQAPGSAAPEKDPLEGTSGDPGIIALAITDLELMK